MTPTQWADTLPELTAWERKKVAEVIRLALAEQDALLRRTPPDYYGRPELIPNTTPAKE